MNRLWTIMRKEVFHIWRDPRTLAMIVVLPALLLVLLGCLHVKTSKSGAWPLVLTCTKARLGV